MANYKCVSGFFASDGGKLFAYGQRVDGSTYNSLTSSEQENFIQELDESDDIVDTAIDAAIGIGVASIVSDLFDSNPSSSASDDSGSFGGFGGGDTGGGGASGDW